MQLFKNLKARILKSIIMWSTMGKQTAQAKEVYSDPLSEATSSGNPYAANLSVI